jgi:hypothetical protein
MVTRRVWRALSDPPGVHPLFQRRVLLPPNLPRNGFTLANTVVNLVLGIGHYLPLLLIMFMPLLLALGGVYGLDCALRISTAIARAQEDDTYNLLSLTPGGAIGASWALCTSTLYRHRDFRRLQTMVQVAVVIGLVLAPIIAVFSIILPLDVSSGRFLTPQDVLVNFLNLLALLIILYLEYMQSTVQGVLVGMLIPTYVQNRMDVTLYALLVFLLLQILVYAAFVLLGFTLLPGLLAGDARVLLVPLRVALFYGLRERVITGLWRRLAARLNTSLAEFAVVSHPARRRG